MKIMSKFCCSKEDMLFDSHVLFEMLGQICINLFLKPHTTRL